MNSSRTIIAATILALVCSMALSLTNGQNGASLFIGNGMMIELVRGLFIVLLSTLLLVRPPRPMALRISLGVSALTLLVGSIYLLGSYQLQLFDALVFITVASVLGFEALEFDPHALELGDALEA